MNKLVKLLILIAAVIILGIFFYFFYPHVWGEIVYPLDYREAIKKYSQQRGLDPNLTAAIIYTESHFNPGSTSGAGARGLMQVMPGTGGSIAAEMGETDYSADKLYDPETNIRYGSWYIKGLIDKYNGELDVALAAYNAGVSRADRWRESDVALPYETVFFIQKIKGAKAKYDEVYGLWWAEPEIQKPSPFYQGIRNFQDFVKSLILGK